MAKKERVYRMTLSQFHRYLGDKRKELDACYEEVEEIRDQFQDAFQRALADWQETFAYCYPQVATKRSEMPPAFARHIDQIEAEERARIRQEIADLERELGEGRAKMDKLLADAAAATETLRVANPEINDREEHLKALVVQYQDEYAQAFEEGEALETFPLGWLTNFVKIRRLEKVQKTTKKQQAHALQQLRQVRREWLERVEETSDTQAELRGEWQKLGIRLSEAQGQRDHLQDHFEALAEQAAFQRVLEELEDPFDVTGELGDKLKELIERNKMRWSYEEGLRAVAEALGLTKGIGTGIQRFRRSVGKVLQEQRRYNLAQVHVQVPHSVAALNEIWKNLRKKVKDEKYLGKNPLEFADIVEEHITARLTDENIQGLFEKMGQALNRATAAWG